MTYIQILRVMYEQYFCNVSELTDAKLLSTHFKFKEAVLKNENVQYNDFEELYTLSIWQPFEDVMPTFIFDNIVEGVKRLEGFFNK